MSAEQYVAIVISVGFVALVGVAIWACQKIDDGSRDNAFWLTAIGFVGLLVAVVPLVTFGILR